MSVEIRALVPEEVKVFSEKLSSLSGQVPDFPQEALRYFHGLWSEEVLAQALRDSSHLLIAAWVDKEMAGLVLGTSPEGGVGTIIWVLVAGEFQRRGIGKSLFSEACRRYLEMGAHKVKLTVPTRETVAFYEKQGMKIEGFHEDHWWHMDLWSMGKTL